MNEKTPDQIVADWADVGDGGEWVRDVRTDATGIPSWEWAVFLSEQMAGVGGIDFVETSWSFSGSTLTEAMSAAAEWIGGQVDRYPMASPRASVSVDWGDEDPVPAPAALP